MCEGAHTQPPRTVSTSNNTGGIFEGFAPHPFKNLTSNCAGFYQKARAVNVDLLFSEGAARAFLFDSYLYLLF